MEDFSGNMRGAGWLKAWAAFRMAKEVWTEDASYGSLNERE